ncbi:hypothetical protein IFM89_037645 [Coptis chinensis]|uniref:Uncharacterized protein n=1 Tax=Coptis chinensis TaxID=261450 RepID=A0A835ITJ1_9MAGN|nr:hypothetical protein IFM89_037645 [Coptis chinensis]
MKREGGQQHGMVRNCKISPSPIINPNPNSYSKLIINTPLTSRPTNHSKFTGKCDRAKGIRYYVHPTCKSKDKGKGTYKIRSSDVAVNQKLVSWRAVDSKRHQGLNYVGVSANEFLGRLSNYYHDDDDDYDDEGEVDVVDESFGLDANEFLGQVVEVVEEAIGIDGPNEVDDDEDSDGMSFCDVGFVVEQLDGDGDGDEDWCLVGEL